jgi:hypothetical protein
MWPHHRWWTLIRTVTFDPIVTIGPTARIGTLIPTAITGPILALGATTTIHIATMGPTVPLMGGLLTALGGELGAQKRSFAGGLNRSMHGTAGLGFLPRMGAV